VLGIGLDFGTTNSTLAVFDGQSISYVEIDPFAPNPYVMPTALYLNEEYIPTIGTQAILQYLEENEGRRVRLTREKLGEVKVTHAEVGTIHVSVHANVDRDMPGQLFHGLKRWLGDPKLEQIKVLHRDYRTVALITPIFEHIKKVAEDTLGVPITALHIGRPIKFEGASEDSNQIALRRLKEASNHAGFQQPLFYPEPLGATLGYLSQHERAVGDIILTFDFGGGTLDLSLIGIREKGFDILATHGVTIGGVKIDQEIYAPKIFPKLGKNTMVKCSPISSASVLPFGFYRFAEDLLNWKNTHSLNTDENIRLIDYGIANSDETGARRLKRLKTLILSNMSYSVHKAIEDAKIQLSEYGRTKITVPEIDLSENIYRAEFEDIIADIILALDKGVDILLEKALISPEDISVVVRTGGSAQISAINYMLMAKFPDKVVEYDVFKSIASGLAIANYYGYEYNPT